MLFCWTYQNLYSHKSFRAGCRYKASFLLDEYNDKVVRSSFGQNFAKNIETRMIFNIILWELYQEKTTEEEVREKLAAQLIIYFDINLLVKIPGEAYEWLIAQTSTFLKKMKESEGYLSRVLGKFQNIFQKSTTVGSMIKRSKSFREALFQAIEEINLEEDNLEVQEIPTVSLVNAARIDVAINDSSEAMSTDLENLTSDLMRIKPIRS